MILDTIEKYDDSALPTWQKRRWRLLKEALMDDDFSQALPLLSEEYQKNAMFPTAGSVIAIERYGIPQECSEAFFAILSNNNILSHPEAIIALIHHPVSYISHKRCEYGPSDGPRRDYKYYLQHRRDVTEKGRDYEAEFDGVYLLVSSYTTKVELMEFMDSYFDAKIAPLLDYSDSPFVPERIKKGRINNPTRDEAKMYRMSKAGKSAQQIINELDDVRDISSVNRTLRTYRKRRKKS